MHYEDNSNFTVFLKYGKTRQITEKDWRFTRKTWKTFYSIFLAPAGRKRIIEELACILTNNIILQLSFF